MKTVVQMEVPTLESGRRIRIERSQVDVNQTWDLSHLFETEEALTKR